MDHGSEVGVILGPTTYDPFPYKVTFFKNDYVIGGLRPHNNKDTQKKKFRFLFKIVQRSSVRETRPCSE